MCKLKREKVICSLTSCNPCMLAPILNLELTIFMTCELFNRMRRLLNRDPTVEIVGSATYLKNSFKQVFETFYIRRFEGPPKSDSPVL